MSLAPVTVTVLWAATPRFTKAVQRLVIMQDARYSSNSGEAVVVLLLNALAVKCSHC